MNKPITMPLSASLALWRLKKQHTWTWLSVLSSDDTPPPQMRGSSGPNTVFMVWFTNTLLQSTTNGTLNILRWTRQKWTLINSMQSQCVSYYMVAKCMSQLQHRRNCAYLLDVVMKRQKGTSNWTTPWELNCQATNQPNVQRAAKMCPNKNWNFSQIQVHT